MRAELTNLNHCAVPFLSRGDTNLSWYYMKYASRTESIKQTENTIPNQG